MHLLLLKAKVRGDSATGDLFAQPVMVAGHMRGPVYVAPHTAIRHKAPDYGARLDAQQARRDPDGIEGAPRPPDHRIPDALRPLALKLAQRLAEGLGRAPALGFSAGELSAMRAADWIGPPVGVAYGAEIGDIILTDEGKRVSARVVADRSEAARASAGVEGAAPGLLARPTYPDGRLIPQPGDKVRRMVPGIFGMPVVLDGVVRGKTVQITSGATNRKQDTLSPAWSVIGDPALERIAAERRAKAEAERQAAEAQRAAEAAAAEADRAALVAARGTLEGVALTPGEVIEDPEGRLHIVAETDERGGAYGYALDDPDQDARGFGRLDGWRHSDAPAPAGAIIESAYGKARRRTADGWEDVVWNEEANAWQPVAAPPPPAAPTETPAEPLRWAKFHPLSEGDFAALRQAVVDAVPGARVLKMPGKPTQARIFAPRPDNPDEMRFFTDDEQRAIQAALDRLGMGGPLYAHTRGEAAGISQGFFGIQRMETNLRPAPEAAPPPPPARPPVILALPAPSPAPAPGAELALVRDRFAKMKPGDRLHDLYRARLDADPTKWRVGMGVTYQVASGRGMQTNRGYRVVEVDAPNKRIAVQLIRDAGYADAMPGDPPMWIWMGEAKRAKADDAAELGPPTRPAADAPGTIHEGYTGDFTSRIHYARDSQGRTWKRHQARDPRYGYRWGAWKITKGDIPPSAHATDQKARLPG